MRALGEYIVSISAAAFLCGIISSLSPKGAAKEIIKLVCGLFLVFSIIRPIADINIPDLITIGKACQEEAREAAKAGEDMAQAQTVLGISQQLEAYILDKADVLGLAVTVEVVLQENSFLPERIIITGDASPLARQQLTQQIQQDFEIPGEDIQWIQ